MYSLVRVSFRPIEIISLQLNNIIKHKKEKINKKRKYFQFRDKKELLLIRMV